AVFAKRLRRVTPKFAALATAQFIDFRHDLPTPRPFEQSVCSARGQHAHRTEWNPIDEDLGLARRVKIKSPPCQRVQEGLRNLLGNSTCSLAVFYVEQVALNRHVLPQLAASLFMAGIICIVNSASKAHH